jgi:hypothetical protein
MNDRWTKNSTRHKPTYNKAAMAAMIRMARIQIG